MFKLNHYYAVSHKAPKKHIIKYEPEYMFAGGDFMEQLLVKLSILIIVVVSVIYVAISFVPIFVMKDHKKDDDI